MMRVAQYFACLAAAAPSIAAEPSSLSGPDYLSRLREQVKATVKGVLPQVPVPKKSLADVAKENEALIRKAAPAFTTDDLIKLMTAPLAAAPEKGQAFTSFDGKLSAVAPTGFQLSAPQTGLPIGEFHSPEKPSLSDIILWRDIDHALPATSSLDAAVAQFLERIRSNHLGAALTAAVPSKLGDVEAATFVFTVVINGVVMRTACTVGVSQGHQLIVFLHAPLEHFVAAWEDYRRVCESYRFVVAAPGK